MAGRAIAVSLAASVLLSACVTDAVGTDFAAVSQKLGPPKPGQSRIVVLQQERDGLSMSLCGCDVKLEESPIGKVTVGTYAVADRPAGRHQLVASEVMFPGDTRFDFNTAPGRTYFFLIKSSARHDSVTGVTMVAGLAGAVIASAVSAGSDNPGPAEFLPVDEPAARTTLAGLQLAQ